MSDQVFQRVAGKSDSAGWRAAECGVLFALVPGALALWMPSQLLIPLIWLFATMALALLLRDPAFDHRELWDWPAAKRVLPMVLARWAILAAGMTLALWLWEPSRLFVFPREKPLLWLLVLAGYPLLSAYPQEIAFRVFFLHRYAQLFPTRAGMLAANALAFGWCHVVMHNWVAVLFSIVGGLIFASTFLRTRSTAAATIEHSLYGAWIFTVGWGSQFLASARLL